MIAEKTVGNWFDEDLSRSPDQVRFGIFIQYHLPAFDILMVEKVDMATFFSHYKPDVLLQGI